MLDAKLHEMGVSRLMAEQIAIKNEKFKELAAKGLALKEIFDALEKDKELREITKLVIKKALHNRIKAEVKRGVFKNTYFEDKK